MNTKRQSLKLDETDWQALTGIAADCDCLYRGQPSWRRLIDHIASGRLTVADRPDKRVQAFQEETRRPVEKQRQAQSLARFTAQMERNRLRQRKKRRAAGIPPHSAAPPQTPAPATPERTEDAGPTADKPGQV